MAGEFQYQGNHLIHAEQKGSLAIPTWLWNTFYQTLTEKQRMGVSVLHKMVKTLWNTTRFAGVVTKLLTRSTIMELVNQVSLSGFAHITAPASDRSGSGGMMDSYCGIFSAFAKWFMSQGLKSLLSHHNLRLSEDDAVGKLTGQNTNGIATSQH